jgi:hypothetical protein
VPSQASSCRREIPHDEAPVAYEDFDERIERYTEVPSHLRPVGELIRSRDAQYRLTEEPDGDRLAGSRPVRSSQ